MALRFGTLGNDVLSGTGGDDVMFGFSGDDTFVASAGSDTFNGGSGNDTVDYSHTTQASQPFFGFDGIVVDLSQGTGGEVNEPTAVDHYSSIENITGSNFNDIIFGDGGANVIRGLDGNDAIEGGAGADTLDGGNGFDYVMYDRSASGVVVDLLNRTAHGGDAQGDTLSNFEGLIGSNSNDTLLGTNGHNDIIGGDGADIINGRGGNDRIEGGAGNDILTGGTGADTFVYFSNTTNSGTDHITDFHVHEGDVIEFHASQGTNVSFGLSNVDLGHGTTDVNVTLGSSAHVILDHVAISDLAAIAQSVHLV